MAASATTFVFFFQAEDGIRDIGVTGVQTCALPICGSHGLATAYYLRQRGITDVAVLEKSYIGSGAAGRNTTILRSNYKTAEGARFYDASIKLYEGLDRKSVV